MRLKWLGCISPVSCQPDQGLACRAFFAACTPAGMIPLVLVRSYARCRRQSWQRSPGKFPDGFLEISNGPL